MATMNLFLIESAIFFALANGLYPEKYDPKLHVDLNLNSLLLISPPPCNFHSEINFLYLVNTAPSHVELRNTLRKTWASSKVQPNKTRRIFFIGRSNTTVEESILKESEFFADIVLYDKVDTYRNMTIKVKY